ncbi:hypothetical protein, partial [Tateyamaria pelophila]|uniref:hypothetical protein n=1 Tax=Tateyamaria pelophila TaxID=328415 RepID=UPI001CC08CCF
DVVPFGAPFMDRGKVPQCPETGTKFRFALTGLRDSYRAIAFGCDLVVRVLAEGDVQPGNTYTEGSACAA